MWSFLSVWSYLVYNSSLFSWTNSPSSFFACVTMNVSTFRTLTLLGGLSGFDWHVHNVSRMMLQHSGPSLADISCSALVPCLSPPGTLTLDDFTNFTPIVKEELRLAIQNKRLSNGLSADMSSDGASSSSDRPSEHLACGSGARREVRRKETTACGCLHFLTGLPPEGVKY